MRICIVSSEYPPFHGGGIGTYSGIQSRALAEAGHDVHVISNQWQDYFAGEPEGTSGRMGTGELSVHRLDVLTTEYTPRPPHDADSDPLGQVCRYWDSSLYWSMHVADELSRLHREKPFDVVEFPEAFAESYVAMRRRRLGDPTLDMPMTITLHSPMHEVVEYNRARRWLAWVQRRNTMEEYCIAHADTLCSPSRHLVTTLERRLTATFDRVPWSVIPNPMEFSPWDGVRDQAGAPPDAQPYLLFVGRIEPRKGIQYLVDASIPAMKEVPGLKVVLIGRDRDAGDMPGSMKDSLLQRIPAEFRSRFVFEGIQPRQAVLQKYAAATACVFPVPWDNFPYTCCEAMASGACVIASGNSGMAEMIEDGRSGLLFPGGDVSALSAAILRVLGDAGLRARLQREASRRIRALCDPAVITPRRIAHYEETIRRYRMNRPKPVATSPIPPASSRLALFVVGGDDQEHDARRTIESVQAAARMDEVSIDVTIGRDEGGDLREWVTSLSRTRPQYMMALRAGEWLEQPFLHEVIQAFGTVSGIAWASSWAFSLDHERPQPFAGFDFSVPLELLYHRPAPCAVVSFDAFQRVGGWNFDLPEGWRMWDLCLAFHQAGLEGIVVPAWLAHYHPRETHGLDNPRHGKAHELILEAVAARNAALIATYAPAMFINLATNPRASSPGANLFADLPPAAGEVRQEGAATKSDEQRSATLRQRLIGRVIELLRRWE